MSIVQSAPSGEGMGGPAEAGQSFIPGRSPRVPARGGPPSDSGLSRACDRRGGKGFPHWSGLLWRGLDSEPRPQPVGPWYTSINRISNSCGVARLAARSVFTQQTAGPRASLARLRAGSSWFSCSA